MYPPKCFFALFLTDNLPQLAQTKINFASFVNTCVRLNAKNL